MLMLVGRSLVPFIVIALVTLRALAHASPPDPSWIEGFYDDADYDDIVNLVTHATYSPDLHLPVSPRPSATLVSLLTVTDDPQVAAPTPSPLHSRAPPSR